MSEVNGPMPGGDAGAAGTNGVSPTVGGDAGGAEGRGRRRSLGRGAALLGVLAVVLQIGTEALRSTILRASFDDAAPGGGYDEARLALFALQGVWCLLGCVAIGLGIAAVVTNRARITGIVGIVGGAVAVVILLA